jgi:hypothetical protein
MKEELQGKLVEILTSIQAAAGKASDFAMAELPDIAQSYVAYGRASAILWLLVGAVLALLGVASFCRARRDEHGVWLFQSAFADFGGGYFLALALGAAGVITMAAAANQAILVWFAPKVWLLKEIAGMLR